MRETQTDLLQLAARFVNSTASHIFLTGKAGTGKTTFLRNLAQATHKSFVIVAPTGIAALNAQGVTIHSQFAFPFGSHIPVKESPGSLGVQGNFYTQSTLASRHPLNSLRKQVLRATDLLIIDEVSMLRADLLDAIDYRMRSAKGNMNRSFGGAQVLMIGDLYQLPPIVKNEEWYVLRNYYRSMHFFESRAIRQAGMVYIELDKIFRQQDDRFINVLNNLRNNVATTKDIDLLNSYYRDESDIDSGEDIITITTHNRKADAINEKELKALEGKPHYFDADIDGDFPENSYPAQETLELRVGAQVMFVKNDTSGASAYFNGKLARVDFIDGDEITVVMSDDHSEFVLVKERWENKKYVVQPETKELEEEVVGSFTQYPVKLAWAVTVHKSQGLTFDKAVIDVGQAFAPGQVYVALSRLTSLDGLILRTRISNSVVSTDGEVVRFSTESKVDQNLPTKLKAAQSDYLERLLAYSFDFTAIEYQLENFNSKKRGKLEFEDPEMQQVIPHMKEAFLDEKINTQKFRNQLLRLVHQNDFEQLLHRLEKGAGYYSAFIQSQLKALLKHAAQVEQFTRTKTYLTGVEEVDQQLFKTWGEVDKASYIALCILNNQPIQKQEKEEKKRIQKRKEWLDAERKQVAEEPLTVKSKSGRKRGSPSRKREKGETYKMTYALIKEGMSLKEIAETRGLAEGTIESHVVKGINEGEVDVNQVLGDDAVKEIQNKIEKESGLSTIHDEFDGKYSYNQLRMVQAHSRRN
ncbi:MAG: helix-turn-helix domain-containing protein [Schleiferiaceae bacterium]|jgi:cytochrome c oxidase assembly protein Cox11|nr:helix-turn-helix domain-containing protein [Schleiferiaceae bacterium]